MKGPKALKSIFQIYREAGSVDKSSKDLKQNINSTAPFNMGKDSYKIGGISFKLGKNISKSKRHAHKNVNLKNYMMDFNARSRSNERSINQQIEDLRKIAQNDYVQINEKGHNLSTYLNPTDNSSLDYSGKPKKSPQMKKAVSLYSKIANKKALKYKKNKIEIKQRKTNEGSKDKKKSESTPKKPSAVYNYQFKHDDHLKVSNPQHSLSAQSEAGRKKIFEQSKMAKNKKSQNVYSSMFSDGSLLNKQIQSMVFPKRPESHIGITSEDYNMLNSIELSQSSLSHTGSNLRSDNLRSINHEKRSNYSDVGNITMLDTSANPKQSIKGHSKSQISSKASSQISEKKFLRQKTTLIGHKNTVS